VAETTWYQLGGLVWSFRIKKLSPDNYGVEKWIYSKAEGIHKYLLHGEPTWANPASALLYRSMIVAAEADQVVAFHGSARMRGTEFTTWVAREGERKPVHVWQDGGWL
jgi:hypothetical protein